MMTKDQEQCVKLVYSQFVKDDYGREWTALDESLYNLDYLTDEETVVETEIQLYKHSQGMIKCEEKHTQSECLVPYLMEAVNGICELYNEHRNLHPKNRYILQNYLAVSHIKLIYIDEQD